MRIAVIVGIVVGLIGCGGSELESTQPPQWCGISYADTNGPIPQTSCGAYRNGVLCVVCHSDFVVPEEGCFVQSPPYYSLCVTDCGACGK